MKRYVSIILLPSILVLLFSCAKEQSAAESVSGLQEKPGEILTIMLNQHPYADAIIMKFSDFKEKTGIDVRFTVTPESEYFDKLTSNLIRENSSPDVFMTGVYQVWDYSVEGHLEPLDEYIADTSKTSEDYNPEDFFPNVLNAFRWDMKEGHPVGSGPLWAIPLGFEQYVLAYNTRIFSEESLAPPKTMEELLSVCSTLRERRTDIYPLAVRGSLNWATIHPGFMTTFANYGASDFIVENGHLKSQINSPQSKNMIKEWMKLIQTGGSPFWSSYTWYEASSDFGAGKAAMLFDADIVSYFQSPAGASLEAGNISWVPAPIPENLHPDNRRSNLWVWGLAMNSHSQNKSDAWKFIEYFTSRDFLLWGAINEKMVDPPRKSIFENSEFQDVIKGAKGYLETFNETINGTGILFTPHSNFFDVTTEWSAVLRSLTGKTEREIDQVLDNFADTLNRNMP